MVMPIMAFTSSPAQPQQEVLLKPQLSPQLQPHCMGIVLAGHWAGQGRQQHSQCIGIVVTGLWVGQVWGWQQHKQLKGIVEQPWVGEVILHAPYIFFPPS